MASGYASVLMCPWARIPGRVSFRTLNFHIQAGSSVKFVNVLVLNGCPGRFLVFRLVNFGWKESEGAVLGLCLPMWSMCMPNGGSLTIPTKNYIGNLESSGKNVRGARQISSATRTRRGSRCWRRDGLGGLSRSQGGGGCCGCSAMPECFRHPARSRTCPIACSGCQSRFYNPLQ